jgi:hypothetical protein
VVPQKVNELCNSIMRFAEILLIDEGVVVKFHPLIGTAEQI